MNHVLRLLVLALPGLLAASPVAAQFFSRSFHRISAADGLGLRSNVVLSLCQDSRGFMWVGTSAGLQRFDGSRFARFHSAISKADPLPTVGIEQILPADSGRLWLASHTRHEFGLFDPVSMQYRRIPLRTSQPLPARSEFRLWTDGKGGSFISILRYGKVLRYDAAAGAFTEQTPLNQLPAGWQHRRHALYDAGQRRYWLTTDSGLCVYDEASRQLWHRRYNPQRLPLLADSLLARYGATEFFIDQQRRYWVLCWPGGQTARCFSEKGELLRSDTAGLNGVNTSYHEMDEFFQSADGSLWIYGEANLFHQARGGSFRMYRSQYIDNFGIRYERVYQVTEDRSGMLWVATDQGLYYSTDMHGEVVNLFLSDRPGEIQVTDIGQLHNSHYWLTTWGKGVLAFDERFRRYEVPLYRQLPAGLPAAVRNAYYLTWAVHQHRRTGVVYIGCQGGLTMQYQPATGRTSYHDEPVFNHSTVRYITEDREGHLWFGTQGGRVVKYDGQQYRLMADFGAGAIIYKILADRDNWIWVATQDKGLYALDARSGRLLQHYSTGTGSRALFGATADDIDELNDSLLVVATGALNILNKRSGQIQQLTMAQGLPSNAVKRVRQDATGYLWIMTDNGLCRYDHRRGLFTSFGQKDGILLGETATNADYLCNENYVMFAGVNSLLFFHPRAFKSMVPPPTVTLTDFRLGNIYLPFDSLQRQPEVRLRPDESNFSIQFSCLDFKNAERYVYYYRMVGLEQQWQRADQRSISFTGLPPGRYRFEVKAENLEGQQSPDISSLAIYIAPHFWQTGWFISTLLMLLAMVGYAMHRLRLNRLMAVEAIRNRVARDLHDDMGSTLSTINILSSMAKTKMQTDTTKTVEYLSKISDNSQRMMEAMDDIVWAIKPANDSMQKLVARLREFATQVLEAKEVTLQFEADEAVNDVRLDMEARRDFFLIGKEAINNAAKYARASRVHIQLQVQQRQLIMQLTDDGVGFDMTSADTGNGLGNMQRRAAALRGRLVIQSAPGQGTRLSLRIPIS